jgi:peptide chain release factor 1
MNDVLVKQLQEMGQRCAELEEAMSKPETASSPRTYAEMAREHAELRELLALWKKYKELTKRIKEDEEVLRDSEDPELAELAREELGELANEQDGVHQSLVAALHPPHPSDAKNVVLEVRAGTGGEEAALFAGALFRMYSRYAERRNWRLEVLSHNPTDLGGVREIVVLVEGKGAYGTLKYESGVHRVQRVPTTEASGRIHTSAASVAVLAEAEEVEVQIDPKALRIDVFRSSGPGGQSVNTTDSAVRITHLPTGIVVSCQDEKSQHKNKAKAMRVLRARLLEKEEREQDARLSNERRAQVGTGDRSTKIRTYNFPQSRVTDHRIGLTLHRLEAILDGDLDELLEALEEQLGGKGAEESPRTNDNRRLTD